MSGTADASAISLAQVHYQPVGLGFYQAVDLTPQGEGNYSAEIPGFAVLEPTMMYYIRALDEPKNAGYSPADAPASVHEFTVGGPDETPPDIGHSPADSMTFGDDLTIEATVTDVSGIGAVTLYWRLDDEEFATEPMSTPGGSTYRVTIDSASIPDGTVTIAYYLTASDSETNKAFHPGPTADTVHTTTVEYVDSEGPVVELSLLPDGQRTGDPVTVTVGVSDESGVAEVKLYYRTEGGGGFNELEMAHDGDNQWSAQIPGDRVAVPAVEYYVLAADSADAPNSTTSPIGGSDEPASFTVTVADTAGPTIVFSPSEDAQDAGAALDISAEITDPAGVDSASCWWRTRGTETYTEVAMEPSGDEYSCSLTPLEAPGVDYYLTASDELENDSSDPADAPENPHTVDVIERDTTAPEITHTPIDGSRTVGVAVAIEATIQDDAGVATATLYYRTSGSGDYIQVAMTPGAENLYSAVISGSAVQSPGVEYYITAVDGDDAANTGASPAAAPDEVHSFSVGVVVDLTEPSISIDAIDEPQIEGSELPVSARVTDDSGVAEVVLYYRHSSEEDWEQTTMEASTGDRYEAVIGSEFVYPDAVELYVEATDGVANTGTEPAEGATEPLEIEVDPTPPVDETGPTILHSPVSVALRLDDITINAIITDHRWSRKPRFTSDRWVPIRSWPVKWLRGTPIDGARPFLGSRSQARESSITSRPLMTPMPSTSRSTRPMHRRQCISSVSLAEAEAIPIPVPTATWVPTSMQGRTWTATSRLMPMQTLLLTPMLTASMATWRSTLSGTAASSPSVSVPNPSWARKYSAL